MYKKYWNLLNMPTNKAFFLKPVHHPYLSTKIYPIRTKIHAHMHNKYIYIIYIYVYIIYFYIFIFIFNFNFTFFIFYKLLINVK